MEKVEILSKKRLLDDFFKVDEVILRHELLDGRMSPPLRRLSLERGDSAAALLYKPHADRIVLVRQFRYPAFAHGPGWLLELVAGAIDEGESPEEAMRREILEEAGYAVRFLEPISTFYLSPGGSSERIFLFYAETDDHAREGRGGGLAGENEEIELVEMGLEEAWSLVETGEILDAKTLVALMWFQRRLTGFRERSGEGRRSIEG